MRGILDPNMDFEFKNIFGSEKHPNILISFLNATLKPKDLITEVEIKNTDLNKGYIEDKFSRLDVKAKTSNDEVITSLFKTSINLFFLKLFTVFTWKSQEQWVVSRFNN